MRAAAATLATALLCLAAAAPAGEAAPRSRATTVGVGLREWSVALYRPQVRGGTVAFKLTNRGEDAHDLQLRGPGGYRSRVSPVVPAGGRGELRAYLARPGLYRVICTLPGHERLGMRALLRVTRR